MPSAVPLRKDFSASALRRQAKRSKDNNQSRRLLSLAAVLDGMNRTDAARIGGMDRQTLRDWVHRFNEAGPDGPSPRLSPDQKAELAAIVEAGPDREVDGVVRWRRIDLAGHRRALRRRLSRAACRNVAKEDRLLAHERAPASSRAGR
jgi:transposase